MSIKEQIPRKRKDSKINIKTRGETRCFKDPGGRNIRAEVWGLCSPVGGEGNRVCLMLGGSEKCTFEFCAKCEPGRNACGKALTREKEEVRPPGLWSTLGRLHRNSSFPVSPQSKENHPSRCTARRK
ncbi:hypothetical protein LIER_34597 [Lithospermum erythrorhizon]|uniref:Uncharacterized protein n=1 Tax=Lithospermum erythrorhizon TaxID=34254 RepID=A0AAV3S392_LITER